MLNVVNESLFFSPLHTCGLKSIASFLQNLSAVLVVALAPLVSKACSRDMTQSLHRQLQLWEIGDQLDHEFCVSSRRALKSVLKLGNVCLHRTWSSADVVLHYPVSVYDDECMTFSQLD